METQPLGDIQEISQGVFEAHVLVSNELGLHARPAALVAQTAQLYAAHVSLHTETQQVDAKSILDILSLAAAKGTMLTIRSQGANARECVIAIAGLVRTQFKEGGM